MEGFHRVRSIFSRLVLAGLILFPLAALAERVQDLPKPTDYVSDFAKVLSPQAVEQLDRICAQMDHSKADAQIAIVTVHNLDGEDAAEYAIALEDKWKMGKKGGIVARWCCWRWTTTNTGSMLVMGSKGS